MSQKGLDGGEFAAPVPVGIVQLQLLFLTVDKIGSSLFGCQESSLSPQGIEGTGEEQVGACAGFALGCDFGDLKFSRGAGLGAEPEQGFPVP